MLILVSGGTAAVRKYKNSPFIGGLVTPRSGNVVLKNYARHHIPWALDNDCFQSFDPHAYFKMLNNCKGIPGCLWVTAPDVVGDARKTFAQFNIYESVLRLYGYPVAYVAQDGIEKTRVPWEKFDCLFIGGSTEFKLGPVAENYIKEAKARGKLVHMGRVNSRIRMEYAGSLDCDSIDGTGFSRFADKNLPWGIGYASTKQNRMEFNDDSNLVSSILLDRDCGSQSPGRCIRPDRHRYQRFSLYRSGFKHTGCPTRNVA